MGPCIPPGIRRRLSAAGLLAAGAAALGRKVDILLQYWALDAFRAGNPTKDHGLAPEAGANPAPRSFQTPTTRSPSLAPYLSRSRPAPRPEAIRCRCRSWPSRTLRSAGSWPDRPATWHWDARQTNHSSTAGDHTRDAEAVAFATPVTSWCFLGGLDVRASTMRGAVVTLGESTTDGANSTIDANHRWTDFLARRLQRLPPGRQESVLNQGISGNRVLHDSPCFGLGALARLDRDVLAQTGVRQFDRALRDPADPLMLLPTYDSGDHMHPSGVGYQAMANAVDLRLLQPGQAPAA